MERKSKDSSQKSKKFSRCTQTDFSLSAIEKKLHEKDLKIEALEKQVFKYKSEISSLLENNKPSQMEMTPSISNLASYQETSPYFKNRIMFSSKDFEENPHLFQQLNSKLPLDTANIEEIDKLLSRDKQFTITPEPQQPSSKFFLRNSNKKPLPPMTNKSSIVRRSKLSLKSKTKLHKNSSIISDLLFQDDTDKEAWNLVIKKFRNDPKLLSQALKETKNKEEKLIRNSASTEPPTRSRITSAYKTRKLSQELQHESRPISANVVKSGRQYRPVTAKIREIDWSKSILDSNIAQGLVEFNTEEIYLNNNQVEEILQEKNWEKIQGNYDKIVKTVEKLKNELMMPASYMIIPPKSNDSLEKILNMCAQLFKARALIIKILQTIHLREDSLLRLMACDDEGSGKEFENLQKLSQEIIQNILFLKHTKFPIGSFIYLGEDYCAKIQRDNESILSLLPYLKPGEIYEGFNL